VTTPIFRGQVSAGASSITTLPSQATHGTLVAFTPAAGAAIVIACTNDTTSGGTASATDPTNGSYGAVRHTRQDTGNQQQVEVFAILTGVTAVSILPAVTWSVAAGFRGMAVWECPDPVSALQFASQLQSGATALSSTQLTPAGTGWLFGVSMDTNPATNAATAGAGFTDDGAGWDIDQGGTSARFEHIQVTTTSPIDATFTGTTAPHISIAIFAQTGAGGGAANPPARRRAMLDEQFVDAPQRKPWIPVSGIAPSAPPKLRARQVLDEQSPETLIRRPWRPVSGLVPSAPPKLRARAVIDEALAPDLPLRSGAEAAFPPPDSPPLVAYDTTDLDAAPLDERITRRAFPTGAPPVTATPFRARKPLVDDSPADERIQLRSPLVTLAPQAGPPAEREPRLADEPIADEPIRLRPLPPATQAAAPVAFPFAARRAIADEPTAPDTIQEREGPAPLRATDAPPVTRARPLEENATQDDLQRRISIPTSGVVPSNPPITRDRAISDEQSPETLVRRPWLPTSGLVPSAPPVLRARPISDEQSPEPLQRKPWAPDFARVDAPSVTRARPISDDQADEPLQRRSGLVPLPVAVAAQLPIRIRPQTEESPAEQPTQRRPWFPTSPPPPVPPPTTRARPISDEHFPETLQRKPWSAFFWRVDPPPTARARPIAEDSSPAEQTFLDSLWRRVRSFAAFFGVAPPPPSSSVGCAHSSITALASAASTIAPTASASTAVTACE
jgi:hypothetical protein